MTARGYRRGFGSCCRWRTRSWRWTWPMAVSATLARDYAGGRPFGEQPRAPGAQRPRPCTTPAVMRTTSTSTRTSPIPPRLRAADGYSHSWETNGSGYAPIYLNDPPPGASITARVAERPAPPAIDVRISRARTREMAGVGWRDGHSGCRRDSSQSSRTRPARPATAVPASMLSKACGAPAKTCRSVGTPAAMSRRA